MTFSRLRRLGTFSLLAGMGLMAQAALAGELTGVSVVPDDASPGATTNYTFTYTLEQDVEEDEALFYVTFPGGANEFSVATGACDRIVSITLNPVPMGGAAICRASYGSGNTVGLAVNTSIGGGVSVPGGTEVEIVVSGVTNPTVAGNYEFDHADGTGIITTQMMDPMFPMVTEKDIAPPQTVTIGTVTPINGACGVLHGKVIDFPRTSPSEFCAADDSFGYTEDATRAYWGCKGQNGGTDTAINACSATLGYLLLVGPGIGDGTASCSPNPVAKNGNSVCTATPATGFMFDSWSIDCTGSVCTPTDVTSNLYIDANFVVAQYPIATQVEPSTAGSVSCTSNPVTHGNNTTCTYTANPGYTFDNWSGDCTGATCALTNLTSAKSVTANFTAPTFTVTVNTSGSGTASCTPNPVNGGSNSTCTASPSAGSTFTGWSGDCTGSTCVLTSVNANKAVTANFATSTYSISGSAAPSAGGSVSCSGSVSHGGNGSCSATANTGYTFGNWSGCPSASGTSCNFTNVTSNRSVTANFIINSYTVTAVANPIDAGSATCTSPVNHGASASCTANPAAGYRLVNWSGACTGSSCAIASVTANSSVTANFALLPTYNISTSVSPVDSGKITCTKDILEGGNGSCTAKANPGYRFTSWGGDCSGNTSCSLENVTGAKSVSATFEVATSFRITADQQYVGGRSYPLVLPGDEGIGLRLDCSHSNPVSINSTVTCSMPRQAIIGSEPTYRGWSGDCSRVEGSSCIIDNITTDKHITIHFGYPDKGRIEIRPAGAGSIWCRSSDSLILIGLSASYVRQECIGEANPGYAFTSFTDSNNDDVFNNTVYANFTKQADTPVVTCTDCTNSTLSTDTTTTQTVSKTSEPDAQGNSTQSTVATTTNTEINTTSTSVTVNSQNSTSGTSTSANELVIDVPDSTVTINDDGSTSATAGSGESNQGSVVINVSAEGINGELQSGADSGSSSFDAQSTGGVQAEVYEFELENDSSLTTFNKPVLIQLPLADISSIDADADLLTLAKIINDKLEFYGGRYKAGGKYFEADRKSFKPRAKSGGDEYAYVSTNWSENVATNLVMRGTNDNTQIKHTATLDATTAVSIETVTTIATGNVKTTLNLGSVDNTKSVTGNLAAGFATIDVSGALGTYKITDKQQPENDTRLVSLAVSNGELTSLDVSNGGGSQTLYSAASGGPSLTGFESTAESVSVTLSYPAAK